MVSLIIAEKPKVAERIANALGDKVSKKVMNGVSYYDIERKGHKILIAPAVGHVYTLKQKSGGSSYPVFDIEWVPSYEANKNLTYTKNYLKTIETISKQADEFISACDYDIEGSLIAGNVIRFACKSSKGKRMKFSALVSDELVDAYENMGDLDYNNIWAGEARHILDWVWGINLSRGLMSATQDAGERKILSIGRVQGPSLKILSDREREIEGFKPEPYWQLFACCKGVKFTHEKEKFLKKEEVVKAKENSGKRALVEKVIKNVYKQSPNPPFDLTSLQLEGYHKFGFAPTQTLEIAQSLYEAGLISYPRTSSQQLPSKLNLPKIINAISKNQKYSTLAKILVSENRFKPYEGKKTDPAHPAIFPTGLVPGKISETQLNLYDLIVKRFLACFAEWALREKAKVNLLVGKEKYYAEGMRTLKNGWIDFYAPYAKFEEVNLPEFKESEKLEVEKLQIVQKKTQPPRRFTPASIIQTLEAKNLGTKATRATIIDILYERRYAVGREIKVTPFGLAVCNALERNCPEILDEQLTRRLEFSIEQIQEGNLTKERVIEDGENILKEILEKFKQREKEIGFDLVAALRKTEYEKNIVGKCPKCGGELRMITSKATKKRFIGCSNYPKCSAAFPIPQFGMITPLNKKCEECGLPVVMVFAGKKRFSMCINPECKSKENWGKRR
jgi:DNA topoisomerase-1